MTDHDDQNTTRGFTYDEYLHLHQGRGHRMTDHPEASQRENYCGMTRVDCKVADLIRRNKNVHPHASKTDLDGTYGEPEVYTEWSITLRDNTEWIVMREHRWPSEDSHEDRYRCEHYVRQAG